MNGKFSEKCWSYRGTNPQGLVDIVNIVNAPSTVHRSHTSKAPSQSSYLHSMFPTNASFNSRHK